MLGLIVAVVAIALPDCINPTLIGADLVVAAGPRPGLRTTAFALAALAVTFLVGLAIAFGLGALVVSILPTPSDTLKFALLTAVGVILAAGGVGVWTGRRRLAASEGPKKRRITSTGSAAVLGAGIAGVEVLTAFPYFAAIAMIVGAEISGPSKIGLLLLYCVVYTLPLLVIAVLCLVLGDRAEAALQPANAWMTAHWPKIVAPIAVVLGLAVAAYGIARLV